MRVIRFDSGFKFDDPNNFWGDPGYQLQEGDPGWTPPPGYKPKKKKPFRRAPRTTPPQNQPTITNTTMPTFNYYTGPNPQGGFRTWVELGPQVSDDTLLGLIAAQAGTTPEISRAVCLALFSQVRACTAGCSWSDGFLGEFAFRPTSGGSQPAPENFQNAGEMNADISLTFTPEKRAEWRSGLTIHSTGHRGLVTPQISTIICMEDGAENHYVAGTMLRIVGSDLRFAKTDVQQGVFFIKADNSEVRATVYGSIDPGEVQVLVPATLSGTLRVRIAASLNGSLRTFTYTTPIV